jgi:hypothetical protein
MYTQARYFIRTALVYLLAAFLVGGLVLVNQGLTPTAVSGHCCRSSTTC